MENQIFKVGDKVFIRDVEFEITKVGPTFCRVKNKNNDYNIDTNLISFTPYALEGFTHERPKPAGMFWDDNNSRGVYGVLIYEEVDANFPFEDHNEEWFKNFEEMTFDEYRKRKGL